MALNMETGAMEMSEANRWRMEQMLAGARERFKRVRDEGEEVERFDVINAVLIGISVWGYDLKDDTYLITKMVENLMDEVGV